MSPIPIRKRRKGIFGYAGSKKTKNPKRVRFSLKFRESVIEALQEQESIDIIKFLIDQRDKLTKRVYLRYSASNSGVFANHPNIGATISSHQLLKQNEKFGCVWAFAGAKHNRLSKLAVCLNFSTSDSIGVHKETSQLQQAVFKFQQDLEAPELDQMFPGQDFQSLSVGSEIAQDQFKKMPSLPPLMQTHEDIRTKWYTSVTDSAKSKTHPFPKHRKSKKLENTAILLAMSERAIHTASTSREPCLAAFLPFSCKSSDYFCQTEYTKPEEKQFTGFCSSRYPSPSHLPIIWTKAAKFQEMNMIVSVTLKAFGHNKHVEINITPFHKHTEPHFTREDQLEVCVGIFADQISSCYVKLHTDTSSWTEHLKRDRTEDVVNFMYHPHIYTARVALFDQVYSLNEKDTPFSMLKLDSVRKSLRKAMISRTAGLCISNSKEEKIGLAFNSDFSRFIGKINSNICETCILDLTKDSILHSFDIPFFHQGMGHFNIFVTPMAKNRVRLSFACDYLIEISSPEKFLEDYEAVFNRACDDVKPIRRVADLRLSSTAFHFENNPWKNRVSRPSGNSKGFLESFVELDGLITSSERAASYLSTAKRSSFKDFQIILKSNSNTKMEIIPCGKLKSCFGYDWITTEVELDPSDALEVTFSANSLAVQYVIRRGYAKWRHSQTALARLQKKHSLEESVSSIKRSVKSNVLKAFASFLRINVSSMPNFSIEKTKSRSRDGERDTNLMGLVQDSSNIELYLQDSDTKQRIKTWNHPAECSSQAPDDIHVDLFVEGIEFNALFELCATAS